MSAGSADENYPITGADSLEQTGIIPKDLRDLDFQTPTVEGFDDIESCYEGLDDAWSVLIGDARIYASGPNSETHEALIADIGCIEERFRETIETLYMDSIDTVSFATAAHGLLIKYDDQWVSTCNDLVGIDKLTSLDPDYVRAAIDQAIQDQETSEDLANALATECEIAASTILRKFFDILHSRNSSESNDMRQIIIGETALRQLFQFPDGTKTAYVGYPFRIRFDVDIKDPHFMGEDVIFGYEDEEGINGTFWLKETTLKSSSPEEIREEARQNIQAAFAVAFNPFGDKELAVLFSDEANAEDEEVADTTDD